MSISAFLKISLLLVVFAVGGTEQPQSTQLVDTTAIAQTIKAAVAQLVAGLNAHDPVRTTAYDAPDIVSMECGTPPIIGAKADREGFADGFARDAYWKVSLIDETVDVASSGDLAVYRGAYNEDNGRAGVVMTHRTNFMSSSITATGRGSWNGTLWPTWKHLIQSNCGLGMRKVSGCRRGKKPLAHSGEFAILSVIGTAQRPVGSYTHEPFGKSKPKLCTTDQQKGRPRQDNAQTTPRKRWM